MSDSSGGTTPNPDAAEEMCASCEATQGSEAITPHRSSIGCNRAPLPVCVSVCRQRDTQTKCANMDTWIRKCLCFFFFLRMLQNTLGPEP